MTIELRDFFAGIAMIGMMTNPSIDPRTWQAEDCYKSADAMIRAKKGDGREDT